jgi:hypothetical protein
MSQGLRNGRDRGAELVAHGRANFVIALAIVAIGGGKALDVGDRLDVPDDDAAHVTYPRGWCSKTPACTRLTEKRVREGSHEITFGMGAGNCSGTPAAVNSSGLSFTRFPRPPAFHRFLRPQSEIRADFLQKLIDAGDGFGADVLTVP